MRLELEADHEEEEHDGELGDSVDRRRLPHRRDCPGLPDHIDPTTLTSEFFIFEIALAPRLGKVQYDEVYDAISSAISAALSAWPEARQLLRGKTFVRYLH